MITGKIIITKEKEDESLSLSHINRERHYKERDPLKKKNYFWEIERKTPFLKKISEELLVLRPVPRREKSI